jgi:hypothetical protein
VTRGEADQVRESFNNDDIAVAHIPRDGVRERHDF